MSTRGRITAAVADSTGAPFTIAEVEIDAPRADEALVRIDAVGLCHADLQARTGALPVPAPLVAGHEGTGIIEEVGSSVTALRPGDRVVLTFDSCGRCERCRAGAPTQCRHFVSRNFTAGTREDGTPRLWRGNRPVNGNFFGQSAFATHALVTERNAVVVDSELPAHLLAPFGCAVQTGAGNVLNVLAPPAAAPVVVIGAGAVGLSAVMTAALEKRTVVAVDTRDSRLDLALKVGATHVVNAAREETDEAIGRLLGGAAPYILESSGSPTALRAGIRALATGGILAVAGTRQAGDTIPLDVMDLVNGSKRLIGVVEGAARPHELIPQLVALAERGDLPVEQLVTTFPLTDIAASIEAVESGEVVKPVLLPV
ncbi:NAD(P)-dependent alcohol dehydrogenase [Streptomyces iconiensis]|uniref:NAD(P)-dependent alcohol dehydrogenase n=1 Tax=Streptomyces iconiensis TaxID=1384038 RepID=A0ABT7A1G0_9ACTN|nr:NAD(P)-dependent alcohol dehydrogenase [Streptomyces iconiensis]MDJ1135157.1 NAD(P)-dependent alcohol dehydrogenase [Streptomyces iconiensis]